MPTISVFFGIIIRMYYKEHAPAHFHAEHQGQEATFDFDGNLLKGQISSKTARKLIRQWATEHRAELEANWNRMTNGQELNRIAPLD